MRHRLMTAENRTWRTLAAVSFGLFMIMLDNTVVNVALPAIQRDLGGGLSQLEWIVSGYALTFAIGPLVGGLLTEHFRWSSIFYLNVPIGLLAIAASFLLIDESRGTTEGRRPDLPGQVPSAVGLFASPTR